MIKHIISDISYSKDWLLCICGWEGAALDKQPYHKHKKEAPAIEEELFYEQPYEGKFMKRLSVYGVLEKA